MIELQPEKKKSEIYLLSDNSRYENMEQIYLEARKKEGRIYADEILAKLPKVPRSHPLYKEWKTRSSSAGKLVKYLSAYSGLDIIDLGCGNGWLSNLISEKTNNNVYAVDVNKFELEQAARVFNKNKRVQFIYADIFEDILPRKTFDAIIVSSTIQYFTEPAILIRRLLELLNITGEIHIIDTNFYKHKDLYSAKHRTDEYYKNLGFSEMARFYNHHSWECLNDFRFEILNKTNYRFNRFISSIAPLNFINFPWIRIKVKENYGIVCRLQDKNIKSAV